MTQSRFNFIIDSMGLLLFALLASTGFLMQFVLPPGTTRTSMVGGMNRHQWGEIHFWIAISLLIVILLHLLMHWRWVCGMVLGKQSERRLARKMMALTALALLIAGFAWPFVVPVEPITVDVPHYAKSMRLLEESTDAAMISGNMNFQDLEVSTGVPAFTVWKELGLAEDPPSDVPLKELSRKHGFSIQQVRNIVIRQQALNQANAITAQESKQHMSR